MAKKKKVATKASVKGKRKPKPDATQKYLEPGMAPVRIKGIDDALDDYHDAAKEFSENGDRMDAAKGKMLALLEANNLEQYKHNGEVVKIVEGGKSVRIKKVKEGKPIEV